MPLGYFWSLGIRMEITLANAIEGLAVRITGLGADAISREVIIAAALVVSISEA